MASNKNGVNQLVVFWPTPEGKSASISQISKWEWSDTQVAVTPVLVIFGDGSGKPPVYTVGGEAKRMPVTRQGARISYQHPINAPFIVREGKPTATVKAHLWTIGNKRSTGSWCRLQNRRSEMKIIHLAALVGALIGATTLCSTAWAEKKYMIEQTPVTNSQYLQEHAIDVDDSQGIRFASMRFAMSIP